MLIPVDSNPAKVAIEIQKYHIGSEFRLIGAADVILIEQPVIEFAQSGPTTAQIAEDANWQQMTSQQILWQLDGNNLSLTIDGALGWIRLNKASGACGVEHKW